MLFEVDRPLSGWGVKERATKEKKLSFKKTSNTLRKLNKIKKQTIDL